MTPDAYVRLTPEERANMPDSVLEDVGAQLDARGEALTAAQRAAIPPGDPETEAAFVELMQRSSVYRPGGDTILDAPEQVPAVWGDPSTGRVIWPKGEPLLVVAPPGVGKTTIVQQILTARIGVGPYRNSATVPKLLDLPVEPSAGRVLYLAADRPTQILRAFRRLVTEDDRDTLNKRLVIRAGPPPRDFAKHPEVLTGMCQEADAEVVVIDSLKDVAIGLTNDEVGAGLNQAIQMALAAGIEVAGLHHQRKGQNGEKPKTLEDVYGSTWITAGAGSVVLLWGKAGDPIVELLHLKQPATEVGPMKIEHDHNTGRTTVNRGQVDPLKVLRARPNGLTAPELASMMVDGRNANENEQRKARRHLDRLVQNGQAQKTEHEFAGDGGTKPARYHAVDRALEIDS